MTKGARKGEARLLGRKAVPDTVKARLAGKNAAGSSSLREEMQQASAASKKRARQAASAHPKTNDAKVPFSFATYSLPKRSEIKTFPHVKRADRYVENVLSGKELACVYVKQACMRYVAMRRNKELVFDQRAAERFCLFAEQFPHVKGTWKTRNIVLEDWQCFVACCTFGFYWAKDRTRRVVRLAYVEVGRKNAKSAFAALVGLYMMTEQEEEGAEVYSGATTYKQALAVFDTAKAMARMQRGFQAAHDIVVQSHEIQVWGTLTKFEALHAQGETLDGLNIYCGIIDELHAHKTRAVYDVIETGMGARQSPLLFAITTAGTNRAGVCYQTRLYVTKILAGQVEDFTTFGIIYTLDAKDIEEKNFFDPVLWRKSNPNLEVSVMTHDMRSMAHKAAISNDALAAFLTKRLNVWIGASALWLSMQAWDACYDESMKQTDEDFARQDAMVGLDLASKTDLNARIKVYRRTIEGEEHYYVFGDYYVPESLLVAHADEEDKDSNGTLYFGWQQGGWLRTTSGNTIDLDVIEEDLKADATHANVLEIGFDPYQATQLAKHLADDGLTLVELRPSTLTFSEPMKELERLVLKGLIHHNGDPVLAWCLSNVAVKRDLKDNIYPLKEVPQNKIDAAVALFYAMNRWMYSELRDAGHGLMVL